MTVKLYLHMMILTRFVFTYTCNKIELQTQEPRTQIRTQKQTQNDYGRQKQLLLFRRPPPSFSMANPRPNSVMYAQIQMVKWRM